MHPDPRAALQHPRRHGRIFPLDDRAVGCEPFFLFLRNSCKCHGRISPPQRDLQAVGILHAPQHGVTIGRGEVLIEEHHRGAAVKHQIAAPDCSGRFRRHRQRCRQIGIFLIAVEFPHFDRQRQFPQKRGGGPVLFKDRLKTRGTDGNFNVFSHGVPLRFFRTRNYN